MAYLESSPNAANEATSPMSHSPGSGGAGHPLAYGAHGTSGNTAAPDAKVDYGRDHDMRQRIESFRTLAPTPNTVAARAELASQLKDMASSQLAICEQLIAD